MPRLLLNLLRAAYCVLLAGIVVAALLPNVQTGILAGNDKLQHFGAFFTLAALARLLWRRLHPAWPLLHLTAVGGAIEVLQWVMGLGREGDWRDMAVNLAGIALGLCAAQLVLAAFDRTQQVAR
ncbi:VanZ family protein [Erythrobacteraceae bacterium CFH 75059]|uniref:VanZ family protein n=1 Tax=Qipengyuania thermophila TaxID=2509361 RepID=UPI0010207C59|nr:VanZ family protein [Qipengyuania thermophila]TCD06356.1 VanZ family protein [Erythrobacteraceae bacterium CFH 75059]